MFYNRAFQTLMITDFVCQIPYLHVTLCEKQICLIDYLFLMFGDLKLNQINCSVDALLKKKLFFESFTNGLIVFYAGRIILKCTLLR